MRRRDFLSLFGSAAAVSPLAVYAQERGRIRRIGVLMMYSESDPEGQIRAKAFEQRLHSLGWKIGGSLMIDYRWASGDRTRFQSHAADLMKLNEELVVAVSTPAAKALRQTSQGLPIVFTQVSDPLGQGFVKTLAHPGGAITGFSNYDPTIAGKWLELLKEIAPSVTRAAIVFNPQTAAYTTLYMPSVEAAARYAAITLTSIQVHSDAEIETGFGAFASQPGGGLIVMTDAFTSVHRKRIVEMAAQLHLPAMYPYRYYAAAGGLIAYGVDQVEQIRGAATYVDRMLKGEHPGDLPVQAPTRYQLVVNQKTAKALGLKIPESFLLRADEVIE
jgi:putative ABC transport system substrate-binding protein